MHTLLKNTQQRVDNALARYLPAKSLIPTPFHEALHYVVFNGGKRLRALLVYSTGSALGVCESVLDPLAASVELIHAYSLVHDDLPAMDNDDTRRGKPSCHCAYNEAIAILVGDGLQTLAFEILSDTELAHFNPSQQLKIIKTLAQAAGLSGMVKGQAIDMDALGKQLSLEALETLHRYKTGALIQAAVTLGALAAPDCTDKMLEYLQNYAKKIGLAFQIQDDILDVISDTATLGKTQGQDAKHNKPSYPALLGLEMAQQQAKALIESAKQDILELNLNQSHPLNQIADYIIQRKA